MVWNFKLIAIGVVVVAFLGLIGTIALLNARLDASDAKRKLQATQLEIQETAIRQTQEDLSEIKELSERIRGEFSDAENDIRNLNRRIAEQLEQSALEDPVTVQVRINKDTELGNRCNELVTGAPATANETNEICPTLVRTQ